jgi:hypothetical protein
MLLTSLWQPQVQQISQRDRISARNISFHQVTTADIAARAATSFTSVAGVDIHTPMTSCCWDL